jgi:hypothetical protein
VAGFLGKFRTIQIYPTPDSNQWYVCTLIICVITTIELLDNEMQKRRNMYFCYLFKTQRLNQGVTYIIASKDI